MKNRLVSVIVAVSTAMTSFMMLAITASAEASYVKVTSTDDIVSGDYLIVYEDGECAFDGSLDTLDATSNTVDVVINNGTIAASDEIDAAVFTIDVDDGTIKSASGQYIYQSSFANGLKTSGSAPAQTNSFSIDGGNAVISINVNGDTVLLKYNPSNDQHRFRYFKSTSPIASNAIALYKKAGETSSAATATYTQEGEDFVSDGNTDNIASLWKLTVTPGSDTITSLGVKVNGHGTDEVLDTPDITGGTIVVGIVVNHAGSEIENITAVVNGSDIAAELE